MRRNVAALVSALAVVGCGGSQDGGADPGKIPAGTLETAATVNGIRGSFAVGDDRVTFQSQAVDKAIDVRVTVNGMALDALMRPTDGVAALDGFAAASGADTQIVAQDRRLLAALYQALNGVGPKTLGEAGMYLRRAVGLWAENPTTVDLKQVVSGVSAMGYTMLCSYAKCGGAWTGSCGSWNYYYYAKHDCDRGSETATINQQIAQLGDHYSCSGDEFYSSGGSWVCGEPDHWSRPYVVGNCFGRSGAGCGGDTQYTVDATNHDGCVRNGHALASLYCDDEFTAASDDELFAPNCY